MGHRTLTGFFKCKYPEKYKGNAKNICYRSSWELKCMMEFDHDGNVEWWQSEEVKIPYFDKSRNHRGLYHPDFVVKYKEPNETVMYEIKPLKETQKPVQHGQSRRQLLKEALTYVKNQCKWEAARKWCTNNNCRFVILTEKELFPHVKQQG